MAASRGREAVSAYFAGAPEKLRRVLRGAARAGAAVVSDEIKLKTWSDDIREAVRTRTKLEGDEVRVTIDLKRGWGRTLGMWAEYGTSAHYITVDDSQRGGRTVRRINDLAKVGVLVINGKPIGKTVFHPGARAEPVFRTALDTKASEGVAEAQRYLASHVVGGRITPGAEEEGD